MVYIKPLESKFAGYQTTGGTKQHWRRAGIGKPEPPRGSLSGYWSRRIDDTHRLAYRATDDEWVIIACRFHDDG